MFWEHFSDNLVTLHHQLYYFMFVIQPGLSVCVNSFFLNLRKHKKNKTNKTHRSEFRASLRKNKKTLSSRQGTDAHI